MPGTATTVYIDDTPTDGADAWVDSLVSGGAWTDGDGGTITISWTAFQGTMDGQNSYGWTPTALAGLREALSLWESVANIDFVEVASATDADAKFWWGTSGQAGGFDVLGWSDLPGYSASDTLDVLFNAQDPALSGPLNKGGLGLVTMVHEIGHLLGLAHPHDGGAGWDATTFPGVDWWSPDAYGDYGLNQGIYTTMGYNWGWPSQIPPYYEHYGLQYGPMALDIAAIQAIYGANTTYASGNNVYTLPTTNGTGTHWSSIWDTGGVDTISNEGSSGKVTIDLRAATAGSDGGGYVSYGYTSSGTIVAGGYTIARGVVIENAIGGRGDDTLIGNAANNRLEGGTGNDTLDGGAGVDTMVGGYGQDTYYVDNARDVVVEADNYAEIDTVYSSAANYTLRANVENLTLTGTASINGKGNSSANIIFGNLGNNILETGGGGDTLHGEDGNDRLILTDLAFVRADGGAGIDTVALGAAGVAFDLSISSLAARLVDIERIDLTGTGDNTLIVSDANALGGVGAAVDGKRVLVVEGNSGDKVWFAEADWTKDGSFTDASGTFDRWVSTYSEVHVEQGVSAQQMPAAASFHLSTLNGSNGFKLSGPAGEYAGRSVASAGDINGDGFDDVIIGAPQADSSGDNAGASYVVFGKASGFAASIALSTLNGSNGFKLSGAAAKDLSGGSVASAGDINGDGFADLIVGAIWADPHGDYSGASYVVFGKASGFDANLNLSALNGSNGFRLSGTATRDFSGASVASAGDFNNDGYDDLIIGAYGAKPPGSTEEVGAVYIVYGKASGFSANIDLSTLNPTTGLKLAGVPADEMTGATVASAGDVNGDGYDDVIVGANFADGWAGASYVVFGRAAGGASSFDLGTVNGTNGFRLTGEATMDWAGYSVASAGDVNGDGFADLIVGAPDASPNGEHSGATYVVFGKASGFTANFDLSTLDGTTGFRLKGVSDGDYSGWSVASAGDVNGDGFADLIVGALRSDVSGFESGASYVVFGKASGFAASIDLAILDGTTGFRIAGEDGYDRSGLSAASAGDVNGDGYDDLIIGATGANSGGAGYVVFGGAFGASGTPVTTTGTAAAEILIGGRGNDVLMGGGGGDVFHAGAGNDRLTVKDLAFRLADGGAGTDTLFLAGAGLTLDLSNLLVAGKLEGIERIDLSGVGNNTLIVNQLSVLGGIGAVVGGKHILVVEGNIGDQVQFAEPNWTKTGSFTNTDGTFDRWVLGNAEVHVEQFALVPATGVTIVGTAGNDIISTTVTVPGQPLATVLGDIIDGGAGADTMAGGEGGDTYIVDDAGDQTIEAIGGGVDLVRSSITWTLGDNVENLTLTGIAPINGTGNGANNIITGNAGNNVLDGGAGADAMTGGLGDDTYVVDSAGDVVAEDAVGGIDTVLSSITYALGANVENLTLTGASAINGTGNGLDNWLTGNAGVNTLSGGLGNDTYVVGTGDTVVEAAGQGTDTVRASVGYTLGVNLETLILTGTASINGTGNGQANTLIGNSGDNILDGGTGADAMAGGLGNDTYVVDAAGDVVMEVVSEGTDTVNAWLDWTLGANVEQLRLMGSADLKATGNSLSNALFGNGGKNVLDGGAGADTMAGGLGDDTYVVDQSDDLVTEAVNGGTDLVQSSAAFYQLAANVENLVLTGTGNIDGAGNTLKNVLTGNAGNNVLDGGAGADTMSGGGGNDTYVIDTAGDVVVEAANEGIDTVQAAITYTLGANLENLTLTGTGNNGGTGNAANNTLTGNVGNNLLDGGAGADTMAGGAGNDVYVVDETGDVVIEADGAGVDQVRATVTYTLTDNVEKLTLNGTAHLRGTGNALANTLQGNDGNNILDGKAGADTMTGGLGDDTYIVDDAGDIASEGAAAGTDTVQASVTYKLRANFEKLILTGTADLGGTGNELANTLTGTSGSNLLDGGAGADTMTGGLGDDIYVVDDAADKAIETAGQGLDTVRASIAHVLRDNVENLTLTGAGSIYGKGNAAANLIVGNSGNNLLDGRAGADTMEGGLGNDTYMVETAGDVVIELANGGTDDVLSSISYTLTANVEKLKFLGTADLHGTGNALANTLTGNAGHNLLDGGVGADTMIGAAGNDTYIVDNAGDVVIEAAGGGTDEVQSSITYALRPNIETLILTGSAAINAKGNAESNVLTGNNAANVLDGGAGADTMTGGDGNDIYMVENAGDLVTELANGGTDAVRSWVSYTLTANVENLSLYGTASIDGTGNGLDNILTGTTGHNLLDGGAGADILIGQGGGDTFRFSTALGLDNVDRIKAFDHAADAIQLDDAVFAGLSVGALAAGAFRLGAVATEADDRILYNAANKTLSYDADGVGGAAAVKFATIDTLTGVLDHTDFLIV